MASNIITQLNSTYTTQYCSSLELAYGNGMMSEGGVEAVDLMFENINLTNMNLMDFGSGLGGVAFHLAAKHNANITGIEINQSIIDMATSRRPDSLKDKVTFVLNQNETHLPIGDETFDIVYSKGVLVHLTQATKVRVFKEFTRVLKQGGKLVLQDWLSPTENRWSERIEKLIEDEALPLYAQTPASYSNLLKQSGFLNVEYNNKSTVYANYNAQILEKLMTPLVKTMFIKKYGEQAFEEHIKGYETIIHAHQSGEIISGLFLAEK